MSDGRAAVPQVYVVRCWFKAGGVRFYTFRDPGRSKRVFDEIVAAKRDRALVGFFDDVGREACIEAAELAEVQHVDLVHEMIADAELANLPRAIGLVTQPVPQQASAPRASFDEPLPGEIPPQPGPGMIGGGSRFAE